MTGLPVQVSRHESEIGWGEMVSRGPAGRLGRHVRGYCGYEDIDAHCARARGAGAGRYGVCAARRGGRCIANRSGSLGRRRCTA